MNTIMGSASPTINRLENKHNTSHSKNYRCNFADELALDCKKGCQKILRYTKDRV